MNQKFIVRFCLAAALLCGPIVASAYAAPAKADSDQNTAGQTITVKGTIFDDQGQPLPGAGVMVKGSTQGTVTDLDGNFEIRVKPNQTLVVSFVGYKDQEIPVNGRTRINAALDSQATTLDDVVVVGYGTAKKANLTGAVDVVESKLFENRVTSNVDQMLIGNVPSVNIAITDGAPYRNAYGYQIRGTDQTLSASSAAGDYNGCLVLIDGVEGDPTLINPNDIESISILKDAAASAIYGSRGAFGVVLITTKSAETNERVSVNYTANFNISTPRSMPDLVTDGHFYALVKDEFSYGWNGNHTTTYKNLQPKNKDTLKSIFDGYEAGYSGAQIDKKGAYSYYGNTDWFDAIYKDQVFSQIHNVSVKGNNGKVSYLISGRLYDYSGIYEGKSDPYQTFNLRSKVTAQVAPWLKVGENIEYTYDDVHYGIASNGSSLYSPQSRIQTYGSPNWLIFNPDGTFTKAGAYVLSGLIGDSYDPESPNRNSKEKITKTFKTTTNATASFFNDTFRINADFSYRTKDYDVQQKRANTYYFNSVGVPTPQQTDEWKQKAVKQWKNYSWITANAYAEYENTFAQKFYLKLMAGVNYEKRNKNEGQYTKYGLSWDDALGENPWAFAVGPYTDDSGDEDIVVGAGWMKDDTDYNANSLKHWRNAGAFYRVNFAYDECYLLEANGRYDGSSVFSNKYQWGFFPSVSAAWRPTQEHWWHLDPKWISALKFRVSYGVLGDCMSAGAYNTEDVYGIAIHEDRVLNGSSSTRYLKYPEETNWMYTWSKVHNFDVGVDASFFNNKLNVTYDYFIRRNKDMLTEAASHGATFGSDSPLGNNADMSTYGWELAVRYNTQFMLAGRPFHFGANLAVGNNYTVVDRFLGNEQLNITAYNYREGQRLGELWGFKSNGLFQSQEEIDNAFGPGKAYNQTVANTSKSSKVAKPGDIWILDLDGDGKVTTSDFLNKETGYAGDKTIIGNVRPQYPFSFGFDFDYCNFYLTVGFQGVWHQDYLVSGTTLIAQAYNNGFGPITKWLANNYGREDNRDALFPRAAVGDQWLIGSQYDGSGAKMGKYPIDRYVFNIGYINLQNVQFGYNLPKKLIEKINLSNARVFFSGENLWNWSPFYKTFGRDFDVSTIKYGGDDYEYGLEWYSTNLGGLQYPKLRTFSLGLSVTFSGGSREKVATGNTANAELIAALAAANAAADAANAAAAKAQAEAEALKADLAKALKAKEDCENAPKPMAVRRAEALHLEDIFFELNQSVIRESEAYKVDNLVKALKANPEAHVSITGYADQATGTELRNLVLTKERAEVVAAALKAAGIGPDRIHTEFYGTEKDSSWTPEDNRLAVCIVK